MPCLRPLRRHERTERPLGDEAFLAGLEEALGRTLWPRKLVQTLEELEDDFKNQFFPNAVINGRIIGSVRASVKEDTCFVGRLIMHPEFQNQGIGSKLVQEIEFFFKTSKRFELRLKMI